jgi:hypothetical protein
MKTDQTISKSRELLFSEMGNVSRRDFVRASTLAGAQLALLGSATATALNSADSISVNAQQNREELPMSTTTNQFDEVVKEKIRRARLSGPDVVTRDATVAELHRDGTMNILRKGTNSWVCVPGDENIIGQTDMSLDPLGLQWMLDVMARKPKPTNPAPGLIYMLNGATQRSYTDPFDTTSPAIPIGPHWMILWPFDAQAAGLSTVMRDAGTMVMFAGTPYAHLHVCGSPWDGNEYHAGDRIVSTLTYARLSR